MRGLENNEDLTESTLLHGARQELDMEKLALIDFTLEDDSLLPSTATPENKYPRTFESVLLLSPAVVSGTNEKEQHCSNSGSMERGEGDIPTTTAIEPKVEPKVGAVKPTILLTAPKNNSESVLGDWQQVQQHDRHLNVATLEKSDESTGGQLNVEGLPRLSGRKTRSARASSNLRKSLAWDKAFSTDEGVLDVDELSLVTKTPRKLPELQPLEIPQILGRPSPAPLSDVDRATPNAKTVVHGERVTSIPVEGPSDGATTLSCGTSSLKVSTPARTPSKLVGGAKDLVGKIQDAKPSKSDSTRLVPVSQVIKADVLKGTRLRLPSTFTGKKEKNDLSLKLVSESQQNSLRRCKSSSSVLSPSAASSALSKKVSSVSRKLKDTLGRVLPGGFGGSAKNCKTPEEGSSGRHHGSGSAVKTIQTPLRHPLDVIGEDFSSPVPTSSTRSKSSRGFLSGSFSEADATITRKGVQPEISNREATSTDASGNGTIVPTMKGSSRLKNVGLLISLISKAGSKKGTEKPSFYSTKISPVFSKTKSGSAASQVPLMERLNPVNGAQSNKVNASGLRLPSPKMGFFDTTKTLAGNQPSSIAERVPSDNSNWRNSRKGLPPKPQQGSPSGLAGHPYTEDSSAAAASRPARSSIPAAPHIKSFGKREKGLVLSVSAPNSPQKGHRGLLTPASRRAAAGSRLSSKHNSDQSHSNISERGSHGVQSETSGISRKLMLEPRDGDSDHALKPVEQIEFDAQSGVIDMPSHGFSTRHKSETKSGSLGEDKDSSKPVNSSVDSIKPPVEEPRLVGLVEKSVNDGSLSSMVENLSPGSQVLFGRGVIDSVLCREEAGSVIDALTTSNIGPSICNKLPLLLDKLDMTVCQKIERVAGAQLAWCPELDVGSGRDAVDRSAGHAAERKILGPRSRKPDWVNFEVERSVDRDSSLQRDHEREDWSNCSGSPRSFEDDSARRKHVHQDSAKVMASGSEELCTGNSRNVPNVGKAKSTSVALCAKEEEQVQVLSKGSHARPPENADAQTIIEHVVDSPSHWSDWHLLGAESTFSHATSATKEHRSPITPVFKRLSGTKTASLEITEQEIPESRVTSTSPMTSKSPFAVNVGILNGIGNRTPNTPSRKERNLQAVFDHSAFDVTSDQENGRVSEGRGGSTYPHKPKQRKPFSSQQLDQSEANGTGELSFPFSEERLRALEAAGQETLQKKSGAVQHSPPNKISPNRNPWSPVKRNGQQLGPFDCTKKFTNASTGQ